MSPRNNSRRKHGRFYLEGKAKDGNIVFKGQVCYRVSDKSKPDWEDWEMCVDEKPDKNPNPDNLHSFMRLDRTWAGQRHLLSPDGKGLINFMTAIMQSSSDEGSPRQDFALGGKNSRGVVFRMTEHPGEEYALHQYNDRNDKHPDGKAWKWHDHTIEHRVGDASALDIVTLEGKDMGEEECKCKVHVSGSQGAKKIHWILFGRAVVPSLEMA